MENALWMEEPSVDTAALADMFGVEDEIVEEVAAEESEADLLLDERTIEEAVSEIEANEADVGVSVASMVATLKSGSSKASKPAKEKKASSRVYGAKPSDRILNILGEKAQDYLVLTVSGVTTESTEEFRKALLGEVDAFPKKVGEKSWQLFSYMVGRTTNFNTVMARTFKLLKQDGCITTTEKGNLYQDLRTQYKHGTAASQSQQMFSLLKALKVVKNEGKDGKVTKLTLNDDSLIANFVFARMGL